MVTVRQIEKLWKDESYGRLLRGLLANRPEASIRVEAELPISPVTAAAMAMVRLDELSQSHVALYQKLLHRVLAKQESDGGWGDPMTTALCLRALLCSNGDGAAIERGLGYLANLQKSDGAWPAVPFRRMPADGFASAFILCQLGNIARFRDAVDFDALLNWFSRNESGLTFDAGRLWDVARLRCRGAIALRVRRAEPMLTWS